MEGSFLDQVWRFLGVTVVHALLMFPYLTIPPFLISPLLQVFARETARRRLLDHPAAWRAVWLGMCSPPSRSRVFREARRLFAAGASPGHVVAYLISAHSLLVYFVLFILALNGPQPLIGLVLSVALSIVLLERLLGRIPAREWARARGALSEADPAGSPDPVGHSSPLRRVVRAILRDLYSLAWPLLLGIVLAAVIAAWGLSDLSFSVQGDRGATAQVLSAAVGVLLAYVSGVPPVGNVYPAAFLWKAEFLTYAGLMTFYLGVLVTPFALPRYADLFGRALAWKVARRILISILLSALVVTAFWYALDAALHAVGLGEPIERIIDSTIEPNDVPWFHRLFWPERG